MKTDLQIAQELEEEINYYRKEIKEKPNRPCSYYQKIRLDEALEEAKSNLEGLGCGEIYCTAEYRYKCGVGFYNAEEDIFDKFAPHFCDNCLAKGVDKAKAIYEGILKC